MMSTEDLEMLRDLLQEWLAMKEHQTSDWFLCSMLLIDVSVVLLQQQVREAATNY